MVYQEIWRDKNNHKHLKSITFGIALPLMWCFLYVSHLKNVHVIQSYNVIIESFVPWEMIWIETFTKLSKYISHQNSREILSLPLNAVKQKLSCTDINRLNWIWFMINLCVKCLLNFF